MLGIFGFTMGVTFVERNFLPFTKVLNSQTRGCPYGGAFAPGGILILSSSDFILFDKGIPINSFTGLFETFLNVKSQV